MDRNQGIYFLGRVQKGGELDNNALVESIINPSSIKIRNNAWTFIESQEFERFVYAKLVKYKPAGEVYVIDEDDKTEKMLIEPNLRIAVSPFVYVPEYSGISFLRVSNHIHENNFDKRFSKIIKETNENFFVDCDIEMITDLQTFAKRLIELDTIDRIFAKVNPPNPLYGHLWKSLKEFLERRRTNNLSIDEKSSGNTSLNTKLSDHLAGILNQTEGEPYGPSDIDITDAAILMAADGYGNGKIEGTERNKIVFISTSETIKNFKFDREPDPVELYRLAVEEFIRINDERHLGH